MPGQIKTITPIGSCRIAGPLRVGSAKWGYDVNRARTYGYTHSSLEALQQIRFLQGDYHPSETAWPLMCRMHDLRDIKASRHQRSDLYLIEISSQKQLTLRGHAIQSNYLQKHFPDFFEDRDRAFSYWSAVDKMKAEQWLAENWRGKDRAADRRILSDIHRTQTDEVQLAAHLKEITARLSDVIVLTHVNAQTRSGAVIPSRQKFIETVKRAADRLNVPCYDPTDLMRLIGQKSSIESGSDSLAHYTGQFECHLIDDVMSSIGFDSVESGTTIASKIKLGRTYQHKGKWSDAAELAEEVLNHEPTKARAAWLLQLVSRSGEASGLSPASFELIKRFLGSGEAYRVANSNRRDALVKQPGSIDDMLGLSRTIFDLHPAREAIELIRRLSEKPFEDPLLETQIASYVAHWLEELGAIEDLTARSAELAKLLRLAPGNRHVKTAARQARRDLKDRAKSLFSASNFEALDALSKANSAAGLVFEEIDILWCRSLQVRKSFEASKPIAERLVRARPDHLNSWILLMRAASKTGESECAVRAAKQVQLLGETASPQHAQEAKVLLEAA